MYCWAWESPSTTIRLVTMSGLAVLQAARQQRVAGDVAVRAQPVDVRPLVLHGRRRRDDFGLRRRLAGVFRCQGGRAGGQFPGLRGGGGFVGGQLGSARRTPARPAGRRRPQSRRRCARRGRWGQCHSRSGFSTKRVVSTARTTEAATMARPWTRLGAMMPVAGEGQHQQRPVPEVQRVGVVAERHERFPASGSGRRRSGCRSGRQR